MIKISKWIFLFVVIVVTKSSEVYSQTNYTVIFYNVENLFDTWDDPETSDEEFTPSGTRHWTRQHFELKLKMIFKALITAGEGQFPDIIGLAEIENLWVLEQLINQTPLSRSGYGIIHKESPDPRGIDVALLYRKDRIKPISYEFISVNRSGKDPFKSRDILRFSALLEGEQIEFYVNHWPSRSGGFVETQEKRNVAARILRQSLDSLFHRNSDSRILIMGDFNATPKEKCFLSILGAYPYPGNDHPTSLINLSTLWTRQVEGTIRNGGQWEVFDQMICTRNLLNSSDLKILINEGGICSFGFLTEPDPTYLGKKPFRTYMGPVYYGGVSDHFPVKVKIGVNNSKN